MGAATAEVVVGGDGGGGGGGGGDGASKTVITEVTIKSRRGAARFEFAVEPESSRAPRFKCRLDRGKRQLCDSPVKYRRLEPGRHVFRVAAITATGDEFATPAKYRFWIRR